MTDTDLVEALEDLARRLPAPPPVTFDEVSSRVRRRARRSWTTAAVVVAAMVGAVAVLTLRPDPAPPPIIDATPPTVIPTVPGATPSPVPPPPMEAPPVTVLIDPSPVPATGATVALVVLNRSDEWFQYGIGGALERWDGARWQPFADFGTSLHGWGGSGRLHDPDEDILTPGIALNAPPGSAGEAEWLTLPPLDPGWYRVVRFDDRNATAVMQVLTGADAPTFTVDARLALNIEPAVVPAGSPADVHVTSFDRNGAPASPPPPPAATAVGLERWVAGRWEVITELEGDADPVARPFLEYDIHLPALESGSYRLVQTTEEGPAEGYFWVTELLER